MRKFREKVQQGGKGYCPFCGAHMGDAEGKDFFQRAWTHIHAWHMADLQRLQPLVLGAVGGMLFLGVAVAMAWGWHD